MNLSSASAPSITLFMRSLSVGGAERVMLDFARRLAAAGEQVELVVIDDSGPYRGLVPETVTLVSLGRSRLLTALPALARHLRSRSPTVVVSTGTHANVVAVAAARLAGPTVGVVVREANTARVTADHSSSLKGRSLPAFERLAYRRADKVLAISQGLAEEARERLGARHARRVAVLRSPIDVVTIQQQAAEPSPHPWLDETRPVVLSVARLVPQKDHETLLRAFALLRRRRDDVRLILLGEGPLRSHLWALGDRLGVASEMAMPGVDTNPFRWIARADVLALTSRWEGLGNVLLQSIACHTPAVATDCPHGPAETAAMSDLITLAPVGDHQAVADALQQRLETSPRSPVDPQQALASLSLPRVTDELRDHVAAVYRAHSRP